MRATRNAHAALSKDSGGAVSRGLVAEVEAVLLLAGALGPLGSTVPTLFFGFLRPGFMEVLEQEGCSKEMLDVLEC